ncbi:hypothetical protein, partial [Escherichia coli]|uniref:hypothetical protein n=1 Tax=Escherichia coli TaxID=562 RepID=UPI0035D4288B
MSELGKITTIVVMIFDATVSLDDCLVDFTIQTQTLGTDGWVFFSFLADSVKSTLAESDVSGFVGDAQQVVAQGCNV